MKQPRAKNGQLLPGNTLAVGHGGSKPEDKAYTRAVRDIFATTVGDGVPPDWPKDRNLWTNAQELAERHFVVAKSGDLDTAKMMIERAEGKVPTAPEDRASGEKAAASIGAGLTALQMLRQALGMREVPLTAEILPALPERS